MLFFDDDLLCGLTQKAQASPRLRQHLNVHQDYAEPCQRLFNAIEPLSYIRPHMHGVVPRAETMLAVKGLFALLLFDEAGHVTTIQRFGAGPRPQGVAFGIEIVPNTWHTVLSLETGSVLLEVKAGPFDEKHPKEPAAWAPEEGSAQALPYLMGLKALL